MEVVNDGSIYNNGFIDDAKGFRVEGHNRISISFGFQNDNLIILYKDRSVDSIIGQWFVFYEIIIKKFYSGAIVNIYDHISFIYLERVQYSIILYKDDSDIVDYLNS